MYTSYYCGRIIVRAAPPRRAAPVRSGVYHRSWHRPREPASFKAPQASYRQSSRSCILRYRSFVTLTTAHIPTRSGTPGTI